MIGNGVEISLKDGSEVLNSVDIKDQNALQSYGDNLMSDNNTNWAVSYFGEMRKQMFLDLDAKQMVDEKRFFHLGIDIWMPLGSRLFSPIDGEVIEAEYESGFGNYGGFVLIKHTVGNNAIYSFYGHLNPDFLPDIGTRLSAGTQFAQIGDMTQNGGYFYHTHLQILTEEGYKNGFLHKGYADKETFDGINKFVLDPAGFIS